VLQFQERSVGPLRHVHCQLGVTAHACMGHAGTVLAPAVCTWTGMRSGASEGAGCLYFFLCLLACSVTVLLQFTWTGHTDATSGKGILLKHAELVRDNGS
jgi:hypothetical protein